MDLILKFEMIVGLCVYCVCVIVWIHNPQCKTMEECFFKCKKCVPLITAGPVRIRTIIESSKNVQTHYHT